MSSFSGFRLGLNQEAGGKAALGWSIERLDTTLEARGEVLFTHKEEKRGVVGFTRWPGVNGRDIEDVCVGGQEFGRILGPPPSFIHSSDHSYGFLTVHTTSSTLCTRFLGPTTSLLRWSTSTRLAPIWPLDGAHKS